MSNTERQRRFRKRNPGYYGRLHAKRRAAVRASVAAQAAQAAVTFAPARAEPLMLPAPVEQVVIPGVNAIPQTLTATARDFAPLPAISHATSEAT